MSNPTFKVRMTTALRAPPHSLAWCGTEAGVFSGLRIDVTFPVIETTGPEAVHGLARGEWDFCQTGTLPVVENVLNGGDAVVLFRNALQHDNLCIALRPGLTTLAELQGKRVGVLSDATSGQTGINARLTIEQEGATATYVGLGSYGNIYKALAAGDIDAGPLPLHLRFAGERRLGCWSVCLLFLQFGLPLIEFLFDSFVASFKIAICKKNGNHDNVICIKTQILVLEINCLFINNRRSNNQPNSNGKLKHNQNLTQVFFACGCSKPF